MKISVFFDHILQAREQTGESLEELLADVRKKGMEAVEIRLEYLLQHEEVLGQLEQADLKVSCIYEFYEMGRCNEEEKARKHIETAVQVGADRILVVPGFLRGWDAKRMQRKMNHPERLEKFMDKNCKIRRMAEGLSFITALGHEKKVMVSVEDFDDMNSPLSGMYGIHWFLKKIPQLRYTLDTGNYLFYQENVLDAWELLKDRVAHVHCKDRSPDNYASVQTGSGCMPIKELVERLAERGYSGYLAIEHFDVADQKGCMERSAHYLHDLLE